MKNTLSPSLPFRPSDEVRSRIAIGWQGRLDECTDAHDVVQTVKDYLARFGPEEIALLPPECRPGRIVDADDVAEYALQLTRSQCETAGDLVEKLSAFMTSASLRATQLLTPPLADNAAA